MKIDVDTKYDIGDEVLVKTFSKVEAPCIITAVKLYLSKDRVAKYYDLEFKDKELRTKYDGFTDLPEANIIEAKE